MVEREKLNASRNKKVQVYRNKPHELAMRSIEEFRSELDREFEFLNLMELAAEAMAAVAWIVEEELEIEWVFEQCKETALRSVKDRANQWLSRLAATEPQNKDEH